MLIEVRLRFLSVVKFVDCFGMRRPLTHVENFFHVGLHGLDNMGLLIFHIEVLIYDGYTLREIDAYVSVYIANQNLRPGRIKRVLYIGPLTF